MRELTSHQVNGCNDAIKLTVLDEPGHGGACHDYALDWTCDRVSPPSEQRIVIRFQNGPIKEVGVNGITHEALIAVLIDRLAGFQSGPFACAANEEALRNLCEAQGALHARTLERLERGVEGTHEK